MRRKASEPDCGMASRILDNTFLCRKQSLVERYISDVIVSTGMAKQVC